MVVEVDVIIVRAFPSLSSGHACGAEVGQGERLKRN
jgi:hypothetical protein